MTNKNNYDDVLQFKAIELLKSSINLPENTTEPITDFNFNISVENKVDAKQKLILVDIHIEVKNENQSVLLGSLSVSCIYELRNFENLVALKSEGKIMLPQELIDKLTLMSTSTARGVMFSVFRGTFLHGAILPIIHLY